MNPSLDNEAYILKHYSALSQEGRVRLLGKEVYIWGKKLTVDDDFIDGQLHTAGSKFNSKIEAVSTPQRVLALVKKHLLEMIEQGREIRWIDKGYYRDCVVTLVIDDEIKAAEGIPKDKKVGRCPIIEITPEIADKVIREERRGAHEQFIVNKISVISPPETDKIVIALRWYKNKDFSQFNTVYPGIVSPALPDRDKQSDEELLYNQDFWSRHAFVE